MTPDQASAIRDFIVDQFTMDYQTTARVLEAVPQENCSYRAGGRGKSGLELARHIAEADIYFLSSILEGQFGTPGDSPLGPDATCADVVRLYREKIPALLEQVRALGGEQLAAPTKFAIWELPLVQLVHFALLHSVHHRGQLSAMLRPMGGKVPNIYGGSLDEPMDMAARATE